MDDVRSVQLQTFPRWEIIAIDDGSTDKSPMLLDEMAICDVRIRVIHRQNFGPGIARNVGISEAKGKYIMFLDSDDMLASEDVLAKAFEKVEATKCDCLLAGARSVTITGKKGEMLRWCLRTYLAPSADVFQQNPPDSSFSFWQDRFLGRNFFGVNLFCIIIYYDAGNA